MKITWSQQRKRTDPDEARMWPHIGLAMLAAGATTVVGLVVLAYLAWLLLGHPRVTHSRSVSLHDALSVVQLVFASVAGAGALVALIVSYRRQKIAEADSAHDRTRVFNERFTAIANQLGDRNPAVQLAGVHAMAGLADDWKANRQTCVDVLCAYLRLPYDPGPDDEGAPEEWREIRANREVRHTVMRLIGAHLQGGADASWQGLNFDFTGVVFDGGSFTGSMFSGGSVSFDGATFPGGNVSFRDATFSGANVSFQVAMFSGANVSFRDATFSGGNVRFVGATFSDGNVKFDGATFSGGTVAFDFAIFALVPPSAVSFQEATFSGSSVSFGVAKFARGTIDFGGATFSSGNVEFNQTAFCGGYVHFDGAKFSGGNVKLLGVSDWSVPPTGLEIQPRPEGLMLPDAQDSTDLKPTG